MDVLRKFHQVAVDISLTVVTALANRHLALGTWHLQLYVLGIDRQGLRD